MLGREVRDNFTAKLFLPSAALILFVLWSVTATAACTVSTTPVTFGGYDVFLAAPTDAIGTISVSCTNPATTSVSVAIGQSPNSGLFTPRQMKQTLLGDLLNYDLYTKRQRTRVWGDGTGGTFVVTSNVPKNKTKVLNVYGRIPPAQDVSAGTYLDTLTVTITF